MEKKFVTKDIYYVDNFFPENMIENLYYDFLDSAWFRHSSDIEKYPNTFFWGTGDISGIDNYYEACSYIKEKLNDREILRIHANGDTFTQHGEFHQDDGDRTYLIGMNKDWGIESGGATEFVVDEKNHLTMSVYPIWNRMVSFPADIKHRALPFFKLSDFRITLAVKTENKGNIENNYKINFI